MVKRRTYLKGAGTAGVVGLTGLAGCTGGGGDSGGGDGDGGGDTTTEAMDTTTEAMDTTTEAMDTTTEQQGDPYIDGKIKFLMSPTEPQDQMRAQYNPIGSYLNEQIGAVDNVEMQYARNYAATLTALDSGTADIAETGPFAAALGVKADKVTIALQRYGYGSWTYSSIIITQEDSDIQKLTDLKGKTVAFADALSASGSLYPLAMLKEAGLSIPNEPGTPAGADFTPRWSSHSSAFQAVKQGTADAAGVGRFIAVDRESEDREYKKGVRELAREKGIPRAPIVLSPQLSEEERNTITQKLIDAPDEVYLGEDGKADTDDDLWFNDVREASAETYQPVIDKANTLGYGEDIFK